MTLVQFTLIGLMVIPLIGVITLMLLRRSSLRIIRPMTLSITVLPIFMILILIYEISHTDSLELFTISFHSLSLLSNQQHSLLATLVLGIDALSLWLMLFITIIIVLTACAGVYIKKRQKLFYGLLMLAESLLLTLFMAREGLLLIGLIAILAIIMFFLIGVWGQDGSVVVARKFAIRQLAACVLLIVSSLLLISLHTNESDYEYQLSLTNEASYLMQEQLLDEQSDQQQVRQAAFVLFVLALICMLPMIGAHHWFITLFRQSHMVVLMLYCGTIAIVGWYVLYRIGSIYFFDWLASISEAVLWILSIQFLYACILLWKQQQLRGWFAYGVWGQMSLIGILMFTMSEQGLTISLLHLLSFVATSSLLCFLLAAIMERTGTDQIQTLSGVLMNTPFLSGSLVAAICAWLGIPGLSQFIGTAHAVILTFPTSRWISVMITLGMLCSVLVAVRLLYKLQRGKLAASNVQNKRHESNIPSSEFKDMRFTEAIPIIVLLSIMILIGCYPIVVADMLDIELHAVYNMWNDIGVVATWDTAGIIAIWTTLGEHSNIIVVFALLMMLAIGLVSRKNTQISALIYWQTLFQLLALVVIIASSYKAGYTMNVLDLTLYVVGYIVLLVATMLGVRSFFEPQQRKTISEWHGLYYRDPRLALMMLWLIMHWMALPFTSLFHVKLTVISTWVEQGDFGLLTVWALLHLMMLKMWLDWLSAIYIVSDTKQVSTRRGLSSSSDRNELTVVKSRNARIVLMGCCFVLIVISFIS